VRGSQDRGVARVAVVIGEDVGVVVGVVLPVKELFCDFPAVKTN
jgi:hypothetical protein